MTRLIRKYNFTNEHNEDVVGCVFDWFEVRVKATPIPSELAKLGYDDSKDKGCATHSHYYENDQFSVAWDIRSSYIAKTWSHLRVKNKVFYQLRGYTVIVDWVCDMCHKIFGVGRDDVIISRIDFAYDMPVGSFYHNILRDKFENHTFDCDKYTEFHGRIGERQYTNYSCGSRSSQLFMRLYYKTIENTDYRDAVPKKQYIAEWHKQLFGNQEVVRFEIEYKPQGNHILTNRVYELFQEMWDKFAEGCVVKLQLAERYQSTETSEFTEKDKVQLVKLMRKFLATKWDVNYSFADYIDTMEAFTDIIENVFNERM